MLKNNKKTIFGWAMYDWANSAFATTVMAGFFPIFFKNYWFSGADSNLSTVWLGRANSIAGVIVALSAPILGAIADNGSSKKKFLFFFAFMGIVMTSGLYLAGQGQWKMSIILFILAIIGFSGGNIFYDSLLTSITTEKKVDTVSALGYSLGYLGGAVLFTINVWMTLKPETFGLADTEQAVRLSFVLVGIWWSVFSIPVFLFVNEPDNPKSLSGTKMITAGMKQLGSTFRDIRRHQTVFLFLIAYWLYIDGVDTIIRMAVDYGKSLQENGTHLLQDADLIKALLLTNFIGFPAAILYGWLGSKIGAKRAILIGIGIYTFVCIWAAFMKTKSEFYTLAITIGLVQGGVQALSRSFFTRLIPAGKSTEYFGFYNMLGKLAVVIGPILMGEVRMLASRLGADSDTAARISITSISLLFIAGATLLCFVKDKGKTNND